MKTKPQKITMISNLHLTQQTWNDYIINDNGKLPDNMCVYKNTHGDVILSSIPPKEPLPEKYVYQMLDIPKDLRMVTTWMQENDITYIKFHNTRESNLSTDEIRKVFETEFALPFYDIPKKYLSVKQEYMNHMFIIFEKAKKQ